VALTRRLGPSACKSDAMAHVTLVRKEGDGAVIELDGPSPHRVPVSRAKIAEVKARLGLARRNHHV
jgi:hypothetical protein